jgi:hypothetical protein
MTSTIASPPVLSTSPDSETCGEHMFNLGIHLTDVSGSRLWRWNGVFRIQLTKDGSVVKPTSIEARPKEVYAIAPTAGRPACTASSPSTQKSFESQPALEHRRSVSRGTSLGLPEVEQ